MNIALIISFSIVVVLLLVALIYSRRELRQSRAETATEREVARREADEQAARAEELQERIVELTAAKGEAQTEAERRAVRIEALEARLEDQQRAFEQEREEQREQQRVAAEQQRAEQEQLQKVMQEQFRNLASDILEEKSRVFRQTNSESIEQLLKPFRDNIADFKLRVETIHRDDVERHGANGNKIEVVEQLEHISGINNYADPDAVHILGTDDKGMDVFVRLMYGGRISLTIGFIVVILETLIGVLLGGISGYFGGWIDQLIMRIVDIFNCIPMLPILLIASAMIDSWNVEADKRIYILMVIITIFSWSGVARLVRGQILSLREQEYITATEVMGLSVWRKIFFHLIPNVMPQLIVSMTLGLGSVILYESTLSYLGLGVQLPKAAWGTMIATSNDPQVLSYHVNMWLPAGFLIVIAVLGFNFIGDGLRDAMDPKARK